MEGDTKVTPANWGEDKMEEESFTLVAGKRKVETLGEEPLSPLSSEPSRADGL